MTNPSSIPYNVYLDETRNVIETCYPIKDGVALIGATTLLHEINKNPGKYPLYSKTKSDQKKKLIITHNCIDDFGWEKWGKSRGSCNSGAIYRRSI